MYYYAVLDEKKLVINLTSSETTLTGANLVPLTEAQYNDPDSIMGMYYDSDNNQFIIPPISVMAELKTSQIQYKDEEKWLDQKLDEIEQAIANIEIPSGDSAFTDYQPTDFISHDLQITSDAGGSKENLTVNVTSQIAAKPIGMYTFSSPIGITNAPTAGEAYKYLAHKTAANAGWVIAFGTSGSIYTNYINTGAWSGWKPVHTQEAPLWSGSSQVKSTDTITPSKTLSECAHGWVLMWSDYNVDTNEASDSDIATTMIPKKNASGNNWAGQDSYSLLPTYVTTGQAVTTACKRLKVYNNRIVGYDLNEAEPANDVVLRAIYEY